MKKKYGLILGATALAGALLAFLILFGRQPEAVPAVRVSPRDVVATLTVTGEVRADTSVDVSPPVSARITRIAVDEGDLIAPGQVLVELDDAPLRAELAAASERLAQEQAAYANVIQGTRPEEITLWEARAREAAHRERQAQSSLAQARAKSIQATSHAQRFSELHRQEFLSAEEAQEAQVQADVARREVARAQAELSAARTQREQIAAQLAQARHGPTRPEIDRAAAAERAARASVQQVRKQLDNYRVVSELRGIVTQRLQDPGDLATPSQPVLRVIDPATLEIIGLVEENDLSRVQTGEPVYVSLDALPEVPLEGRVTRIGSRVNPENGTVEVRAVPAPDAWKRLAGIHLLPGMTADVNIVTDRLRNVMVIPATAVRSWEGGKPGTGAQSGEPSGGNRQIGKPQANNTIVYRFEGQRLKPVPVKVVRISMENFQVLSGLQSGDWIAAVVNENLTAKRKVKPVPQEQAVQTVKPPTGGLFGGGG
jgi:multidrug efflux pump subunit AcrA (membrane-fusion protein)